MVCRVKDINSFFITVARFNLALKLCLTFLTSESVTVTAINVVPFVSMILKETKRMNTVLIVKVVWLVFRPVMEVIRCSIAPHKFPFSIYIREPQPRMLPAMETLNINILFLTVDTGKISPQGCACTLAVGPRITRRYFPVTISIEILPFLLTNIFWDKRRKMNG